MLIARASASSDEEPVLTMQTLQYLIKDKFGSKRRAPFNFGAAKMPKDP